MTDPGQHASLLQLLKARLTWSRLASLLAAGALAGMVVGGLDIGLALRHARPSPATLLSGAGIGASAALLLCLPAFLLFALGGAVAARIADRFGLGRFASRDASADRTSVVRLHAVVATLGVALLAALASSRVMLIVLRAIQDDQLRDRLIVAGFGGAIFGISLATRPLAFVLERGFRRVDQRLLLPRPARPAARWAVFLGLPLIVFGALAQSSPALSVVAAAAMWLGALLVMVAVLDIAVARSAKARFAEIGLVVLGAAAIVVTALVSYSPLVERGFVRQGLRLLRAITDFDRDGSSSLFNGGDCAPFNAAVHPGAKGENDCTRNEGLPRFSGRLSAAEIQTYSVVWFVVDGMRSDRASIAGYNKPTTPYLARLAPESLVFTDAIAPSSAPSLSLASALAGKNASALDWKQTSPGVLGDDARTLAARFGAKGYVTGLVGTSEDLQAVSGFSRTYELPADRSAQAMRSTALAVSFIERALLDNQPFFLVVHVPGPAQPYVSKNEGYVSFGTGEAAAYDNQVASADRAIGFVLESLRAHPETWDRSVIVASGLSAEVGSSPSLPASACGLYDVTVPLLLRVPSFEPGRHSARVSLLDVVPTLIELVDLPRDGADLEGVSLLVTTEVPDASARRTFHCADRDSHFVFGGGAALMKSRSGAMSAFEEGDGLTLRATETANADLESELTKTATGNLWR